MVIIGSDHSGILLKEKIIKFLENSHIDYTDVVEKYSEDDDYPDIATVIGKKVLEGEEYLGIAICGTGIGMSIACNKIKGIRAAMCTDEYMAEMARKHNDANILCLGARLEVANHFEKVEKMVQAFLSSSYEAGRHERRLTKIHQIENVEIKEGI